MIRNDDYSTPHCSWPQRHHGQVAPNNSFKPTPHRGVNSVLCATMHAVATPLRGGLAHALGGWFCGGLRRVRSQQAETPRRETSGTPALCWSASQVRRA